MNLWAGCDTIILPNKLYNAENENITIGVLYPFCTNNEFVKNTNSVSVGARSFLFRRVGLATNGVCVFGALTSVSALFYFIRKKGDRIKDKYLYNPKRHTLHIKGYCVHTRGNYPDYYLPFSTENEAILYDGRAVSVCKLCQAKKEKKLEE